MRYPRTPSQFKSRYPEFRTNLYTLASEANYSGSNLTDRHSADKLHLCIETNYDSPRYLDEFTDGIADELNAVPRLTDQITAFRQGAELRIAPQEIRRFAPDFAVPYNQLAIAIEEPPSVSVEEGRRPGSRHRVQVIREGYVTGPEVTMLDFGTSDPVVSDQASHEPFVVCHEEVTTQD